MTVSRWKVMAGMLGISLGGLAALAGQSSKTPPAKPAPAVADAPKPPAAEPPAILLPPPVAVLPGIPLLPEPPKAVGEPLPLPSIPAVGLPAPPVEAPTLIEPALSKPKSVIVPVKAEIPAPPADAFPKAEIPVAAPTVPADLPAPPKPGKPTPPPAATFDLTPAPSLPPVPTKAVVPPPAVKPAAAELPAPPVTEPKAAPPADLTPLAPPKSEPLAAPSTPAPSAPVADTTPARVSSVKYRILLRVGEGEPMFEVRSGDDLVMKVMCEKVDVKSPAEKGQSLSAVKAMGKVRFVGFGAEGMCEELSFLAGTGEVQLMGAVKVQVKDKLGRVESELVADKMHYRLDAATMPGTLRP